MTAAQRAFLTRIMNALRRDLAGEFFLKARTRFAEDDLSLTGFALMMSLRRGGPRNLGELARSLARTPSSTSRMVDRLVRRGLVVRRESESDRRAKRIEVSAKGLSLLDRYERSHTRAHIEVFDFLTPRELAKMIDGLQFMEEALRRRRDSKVAQATRQNQPRAPRAEGSTA